MNRIRVKRESLLSTLCFLGGSALIAVGWWDYWHPDQINQLLAGGRIYPFYWHRFGLTLVVVLPVALLALWLGEKIGGLGSRDVSQAQRQGRAAWGFAAAFAIPFILILRYRVTWLGINYGSSVWTYLFILVLSAVITWLAWPVLRNKKFADWLDRQGPMIILTGVVIYVVLYGGLSVMRHTSFRTHALDLGTMDQAVWNTSMGRLLEYTPLPLTFDRAAPDLSPHSRLEGGRLELILLPLSLLYWIWADPRLLIALQAILLASGAIPLYHLARAHLKDGTASLLITLSYLSYLPLHYVTLADFHASALMVPFLLWAWHLAEQRRWRNYYLAIGIALLCGIDAALVLLGIGGFFLLRGLFGSKNGDWRGHGAATLLLGSAWIALDLGLISPWARAAYESGNHQLLEGRYVGFDQNIPGIVWRLPTYPMEALRVLVEREIFQSLVDLLANLGGLPLLAPLFLLPSIPALVMILLAAALSQSTMLAHYFAPVIPFLFIAAVQGSVYVGQRLARLADRDDQPGLLYTVGSRLATSFALTTALLAALFLSTLPPGWKFRLAEYYQASVHERALANVLDLIPPEATVSAQTGLFPHLSRRSTIYLFPTVADAEYVVLSLDYSASKAPVDNVIFYRTVEGFLADPAFHIAAFDNGVLLLQRGPGQAPPGFAETLADYRTGLYRSALTDYRGPIRLRADNMYQTGVVLENRGTQRWETIGPHPIHLSYHWWTTDGELVAWDGLRTPLRRAVNPKDILTQQVRFVTPAEPGNYILEWDLIQESRAWFGERGGITLRVDVLVE